MTYGHRYKNVFNIFVVHTGSFASLHYSVFMSSSTTQKEPYLREGLFLCDKFFIKTCLIPVNWVKYSGSFVRAGQ
jgi:hypothetical protein